MATPQEKRKAIGILQSISWDLQQVELSLRLKGQFDAAEKIWAANQRLATEIDVLIGQVIEQWSEEVPAITADLAKAESNVTDCTASIKQDFKNAQLIVRAVGLVDDLVELARKLAVVV